MGTWDKGAFDNDDAADFSGDLDDAEPGARVRLIREALTAAADNADYLEAPEAFQAIAAAAVVASQQPDGPEVDSVYGPSFLSDGDSLDLPDELVELSLRAIARVLDEESEWREQWEEAEELTEAIAALEPIRAALNR
ncbi:DUF4259 domain-containing protein [Actinocrispum wychmicini]|uniref:Uncharacterized protein DUF4259 n=1 Tax=Actinocrispum wychmicini TaxID=1213861 RepID=A0A4R2K1Z0_9PSEU|nr:DUF4259 domain-containing protein [Actinocrispum wychmicini]TCO65727.1 uncharacterized protein DUF4259 [Actinocrispum wychmicini]